MKREIIKIDEELCNGCGECVPNCAEGSLVIIDGKAKMVADKYCDGLGACLGHCPQGALTIEVRDADEYDHSAVEDLLQKPLEVREAMAKGEGGMKPSMQPLDAPLGGPLGGARPSGGGCPGSGMMSMKPAAAAPKKGGVVMSSLSHWPIQLRLVPPNAPFLKDADLLLTADCVAVSVPDYHERFVAGKVVLMGCPKFDDVEMYVERLAEMFKQNDIKSVTLLEMEVPCCSNFTNILSAAMEQAGSKFPVELVIAARDGQIMAQKKIA